MGVFSQLAAPWGKQCTRDPDKLHGGDGWIKAWDDAMGKELRFDLARPARRDEVEYFKRMNVYTNAPIQ